MGKDLSATDAGFIYFETDSSPMHIASVQVLALPEGMNAERYMIQLREMLHRRRFEVDYLTRKLNSATLQWEGDDDFDIDRHLRICAVDGRGDQASLDRTIARLHEMPMPRDQPLWDMTLVTGLADGRVALYNRIHHACIDGAAGQIAIERLSDPTATCRPAKLQDATIAPRATPLQEWLSRSVGMMTNQIDNWHAWPARLEAQMRTTQLLANPEAALTLANATAPRTPFNKRIGAERCFASGELPLYAAKQLARSAGVSLNEVFMAICAGGLRRYLRERNQLPDASLQSGVPVSLRNRRDRSFDNQVTMMRVALGTHIDHPAHRLQFIHRASGFAKRLTVELARMNTTSWRAVDTAIFQWSAAQELRRDLATGTTPPSPFNVVISNVPGPRKTRYLAGAEMLTHYPVSVPAHGLGLNITVQSYNGRLYFGITGCARALSDAHKLRNEMLKEWEALKAALQPQEDTDPHSAAFERMVA